MSSAAPRRNGGGRSSSRSNNSNYHAGGGRGSGQSVNINSTVFPSNTDRGGRNPRRGPGRPKSRAVTNETTSSSPFARDEVSYPPIILRNILCCPIISFYIFVLE
jgi:hypothetical protein